MYSLDIIQSIFDIFEFNGLSYCQNLSLSMIDSQFVVVSGFHQALQPCWKHHSYCYNHQWNTFRNSLYTWSHFLSSLNTLLARAALDSLVEQWTVEIRVATNRQRTLRHSKADCSGNRPWSHQHFASFRWNNRVPSYQGDFHDGPDFRSN